MTEKVTFTKPTKTEALKAKDQWLAAHPDYTYAGIESDGSTNSGLYSLEIEFESMEALGRGSS